MRTFGPALFEKNAAGGYKSAIGTLYPEQKRLYTDPPIHSFQRARFSAELAELGKPVGAEQNLDVAAGECVDLVFEEGDHVLIRPEFDRLDLAFEADRLMQEEWKVPKYRIRFAGTHDRRMRQALRVRGELWRLASAPADCSSAKEIIERSRIGLGLLPIYRYNAQTGTRWLTFHEFSQLGQLDDAALAAQLHEISEHVTLRNRHGHPEIAFFGADVLRFGSQIFPGRVFVNPIPPDLRQRFEDLKARFAAATRPELQMDNVESGAWRAEMFAAITAVPGQRQDEGALLHPGLESLLKVRWLPGGRFEQGEFIFESFLPSPDQVPGFPELQQLWDPLARGFIANFIREFGNIEYLNLGRVEASVEVSQKRPGRRGVYLAQVKVRGESHPRELFLRLQRWGILERLAEKKSDGSPAKELVQAILETDEYLEYTLDRRLGCLQFGMHLPARVHMRRVIEPYRGDRPDCWGRHFAAIYFERDCLPGIPTNRIPARKLNDPRYAQALAELLGRAAAPNLVVGRTLEPLHDGQPGEPLFDNGDEIVMESDDGLPRDLVLVDHSGAFADWKTENLLAFAKDYANPVNRRSDMVAQPAEFASTYLDALGKELERLREDYIRRRVAFDGLFRHLPNDGRGNFACRWEYILKRLFGSDLKAVLAEVKRHIAVLTCARSQESSGYASRPEHSLEGSFERSAPGA